MTESPRAVSIPGAVKMPAEESPGHSEQEDRRANPDWAELVARIRVDDADAMAELYQIFARGVRFYLCRQLGPLELEDRVHDTFVIVVQAIRRGDLREPERLMGFIRTIVRRQVSSYIEQAVHRRREQVEMDANFLVIDRADTPEQTAMQRQRRELLMSVLSRMANRDREILTRFYLHEQTQEQICAEMSLTETQFRLLKSRAKARFGEVGKKKVQRSFTSLFVRTSTSAAH